MPSTMIAPLTPAWTPLKDHRKQSRMWRCGARFVAADCGRGSGKTTVAQRFIVRHLNIKRPWPNPRYFYLLPTYRQAKRVAWKELKALIPKKWIARINESDLEIETIYGSTLYVFGMDKPSRFEGLQYDGGIIDESCDQKPGMFNKTVLPALGTRHGWAWRIGVPKRSGPAAREFREACVQWSQRRKAGDRTFARFTWPSSDIMTAEEIENARSMTSDDEYREQYEASWDTASGKVYYSFDADSIQPWQYEPGLPLVVGSDFNVNPMAWVVMQIHDNAFRVFDELWLANSNTQKTLDELHRRYPNHATGWVFIGDASAQSRHPSAATTDYLQIKNDLRFKNAQVLYPASNPPVVNRIASVNWAFRAASGKRSMFIDKRCLHLIKDLEYLSYLEGSREIDDRDKLSKHITDALGYPIQYLRPMRMEAPIEAPKVFVM